MSITGVVIVTGAGGAIGQATALRLADSGMAVMVAELDTRAGSETAKLIADRGGLARFVETDVSDPRSVEAMVDAAESELGPVTAVVNNAAMGNAYVHILDMSLTAWQRMLDVSLTGVFLCSQAVARRMVQGGRGGRIINIGTVGAIQPLRDSAHYSAAKAGLVGLSKALALELSPYGILVSVIHPGAIARPADRLPPAPDPVAAAHATPIAKIPLGRFGTVDEIAGVVAFLASDDASYIQGAEIAVDGGYLLT